HHYRLIKEVADTDRALRNWLTDLPDDRIHDARFLAEKDDPDPDLALKVKETGAKPPVREAVQLLGKPHAHQNKIHRRVQQLQSYRGLEIGFDPEKDTWSVHATFVDLNKLPEPALNGPCRPIIVLTADPVPTTGGFKMAFTTVDHMFTGLPASVPITLDSKRMEQIRRYTLRLLTWIGRQPQWSCQDGNMPYLVVPTKAEVGDAQSFDFEKQVDMDEVARLGEWTTKPVLESGIDVSLAELSDRILLERHNEDEAVVWAMKNVTGMGWLHVSRIERMQNWATGIFEDDTELESCHTKALPPTNTW
ncbi:hypothetical protein A4X13_0g9573, partial [Tilletia indica]